MNFNKKRNKRIGLIFLLTFCLLFSKNTFGQEERRVSFLFGGGLSYLGSSELNTLNIPTKVFGGFAPAPSITAGIQFKLLPKLYTGEQFYTYLASRAGYSANSKAFRTYLKYYFAKDTRKFLPYIMGSFNYNLSTIHQKEFVYIEGLTGTDNTVGNGFVGQSILHRNENLKLSNMNSLGFSGGIGTEIKLAKRWNLFLDYNFTTNQITKNSLFTNEFQQNQFDMLYHSANIGLRFRLLKPQKQLLAELNQNKWRNYRPVDVKGVIIYKNNNKRYKKALDILRTDTSENIQIQYELEPKGISFWAKGIEPGNYKFMLPKEKRKIIRADLQIISYNYIEIVDEELELEMIEPDLSENFLSRDANFGVLLREGFQHEIELATTAENLGGNIKLKDPNCRVKIVLRDQNDSIISEIDTLTASSSAFNFVDINPGNYKMEFIRLNENCQNTEFEYEFKGAQPYIQKQFNANEPIKEKKYYSLAATINEPNKKTAPKGTNIKLVEEGGRVVSTSPIDEDNNTHTFKNLNSGNYYPVFEDPTHKATIQYRVIDDHDSTVLTKELPLNQYHNPAEKGPLKVSGTVSQLPSNENSKTKVYLTDESGKVLKSTNLSENGEFVFNDLPKEKYKVVYEPSDIAYEGILNYNISNKEFVIRKIQLPDLISSTQKVDTIHTSKNNVFRENKPLQIVEKAIIDSSIYKDDQPKVNTTKENNSINQNNAVNTTEDNTNNTPITSNVANETPIVEEKIKKKDILPTSFNQFDPYKTYDDEGFEAHPEGYGVQIAGFFIPDNLERFCQRVRAKGEKHIYIQVIMRDKNDPSKGLVYRVILGSYDDREKAIKRFPELLDKGFDVVLRKHL